MTHGMKRYLPFLLAASLLLAGLPARGVPEGRHRPAPSHRHVPGLGLAYDLDMDFRFDNREYDRSSLSNSMTIFGVRLTPSVGLQFISPSGSSHRLMAGIDIRKDFGDSLQNLGLFREMQLYYRWNQRLGKTDMTLVAGIFPRGEMQGRYSTAFFSDSLKFYDSNIEGLILKFRRPSAFYELGCDWMGMFGDTSRERFMIFSSGEARLAGGMLFLGYSGTLYHYASSRQVWGVVDNMLLNPYIGADLSGIAGMQRLGISVGWLQSFQNDRRNVGRYVFPGGGELLLEVRNWNVGLRNRLYYGTNLMPYYGSTDAAGTSYGNNLYFGDPFWQLGTSGPGRYGIYDRLDVYYEPRIAPFLDLRIAASFHFNGKSSGGGWQQTVSLLFDLESLMSQSSHGR